ncbi:MAG: uncharacterized protein KVP18_000968 [Porospora cf. gigantea A]|uniref:uncharacterized protein n=1 Tax=Porospora cf. gigantea A TaxID=2853593 RepID=UPI00355A83E6|nr:MAG: hypothetical protein KVP18_000968 [Porospora cf. gigantea A]
MISGGIVLLTTVATVQVKKFENRGPWQRTSLTSDNSMLTTRVFKLSSALRPDSPRIEVSQLRSVSVLRVKLTPESPTIVYGAPLENKLDSHSCMSDNQMAFFWKQDQLPWHSVQDESVIEAGIYQTDAPAVEAVVFPNRDVIALVTLKGRHDPEEEPEKPSGHATITQTLVSATTTVSSVSGLDKSRCMRYIRSKGKQVVFFTRLPHSEEEVNRNIEFLANHTSRLQPILKLKGVHTPVVVHGADWTSFGLELQGKVFAVAPVSPVNWLENTTRSASCALLESPPILNPTVRFVSKKSSFIRWNTPKELSSSYGDGPVLCVLFSPGIVSRTRLLLCIENVDGTFLLPLRLASVLRPPSVQPLWVSRQIKVDISRRNYSVAGFYSLLGPRLGFLWNQVVPSSDSISLPPVQRLLSNDAASKCSVANGVAKLPCTNECGVAEVFFEYGPLLSEVIIRQDNVTYSTLQLADEAPAFTLHASLFSSWALEFMDILLNWICNVYPRRKELTPAQEDAEFKELFGLSFMAMDDEDRLASSESADLNSTFTHPVHTGFVLSDSPQSFDSNELPKGSVSNAELSSPRLQGAAMGSTEQQFASSLTATRSLTSLSSEGTFEGRRHLSSLSSARLLMMIQKLYVHAKARRSVGCVSFYVRNCSDK